MPKVKERRIAGDVVLYKDCQVLPSEGLVFSRWGTELGRGKAKFQYIDADGRKHQVLKLKFVYEAVNGELPRGRILLPKDGDELNCKIDNALIISRKEYFKDYDYSYAAAADQETIDRIKYDKERGYSFNQLVTKYRISSGTIMKIVKGEYYNDVNKKTSSNC